MTDMRNQVLAGLTNDGYKVTRTLPKDMFLVVAPAKKPAPKKNTRKPAAKKTKTKQDNVGTNDIARLLAKQGFNTNGDSNRVKRRMIDEDDDDDWAP